MLEMMVYEFETNLLNFNSAFPKFEHRILLGFLHITSISTLWKNAALYSQRIVECQPVSCPRTFNL